VIEGRSVSGPQLDVLLELAAERGFVRIELSRDVTDINSSDVVIVATDSTNTELIRPELLKRGAIVCCASVPSNLSREFVGNPNFAVFDGGLARLPARSEVDYPGFPGRGLSFGCHSESIIAGVEHGSGFRSVGVLTAFDVALSAKLARRHGFELGGLRLHSYEPSEMK
jgi:predicted amino acid dehydrogenase